MERNAIVATLLVILILLGYQCYVDISTCGYVDIHEVKNALSHTQVRLFVNPHQTLYSLYT